MPRQQIQLLRYLAPPRGDFPDFLTPSQAAHGIETGIDAVLSTPQTRMHRELSILPGTVPLARSLAEGDIDALTTLGAALHGYHRAVIAPYWSRIQPLIDAERAVRARLLLDHGISRLLATLGPSIRWKPPILEADYPSEHEIHLAGRGLVLIPSAFCWRTPITLIDPGLPPVLVYPITRGSAWWIEPEKSRGPRTLASLLGPTRAACLRVIENGCTTGELARRIDGTYPTASQHAAVLREAGLIISTRQRNTVIHTLTPLGATLLNANPQGGTPN